MHSKHLQDENEAKRSLLFQCTYRIWQFVCGCQEHCPGQQFPKQWHKTPESWKINCTSKGLVCQECLAFYLALFNVIIFVLILGFFWKRAAKKYWQLEELKVLSATQCPTYLQCKEWGGNRNGIIDSDNFRKYWSSIARFCNAQCSLGLNSSRTVVWMLVEWLSEPGDGRKKN